MATKKALHELFIEELRDLYSAEKQIIKALPKMIKSATSVELRQAFEAHLQETNTQIERLEQCFDMLDARARAKTCEAMRGILDEAQKLFKEGYAPEVLDAAMVAAAQKVEHYEIAGYGTVAAWAQQLGLKDVAKVLHATLEEERRTDEKLNKLAMSDLNQKAVSIAVA